MNRGSNDLGTWGLFLLRMSVAISAQPFATPDKPPGPRPSTLDTASMLSVDVDSGLIRVPFIDAGVGSPILDIKPYHPAVDRIRDVSVSTWCAGWPQWYEDSATFDWGAVFENVASTAARD